MHEYQAENKRSEEAQQAKIHKGAFARRARVRSPALRAQTQYESAFHSVYGRLALEAGILEQDRLSARPLLEELLAQPERRRSVLLRNSKRFASWGLAEQALSRAHQVFEQDPTQAATLATLSQEILETLSDDQGSRLVNDLVGRAWAYRATCHRLNGEMGQAKKAFQQAERSLVAGTGDPFEWVHILDLRTAHEIETGNLNLALELLEQTIHLYRRIEDGQLLVCAQVRRARLAALAGRNDEALQELDAAEAAMREPYGSDLPVLVQRTRVEILAHSGAVRQAWSLLPSVRRKILQAGDREALLTLRQLDGQLADQLGYRARAERSFKTLYDARRERHAVRDGAASRALEGAGSRVHSRVNARATSLASAFLDLTLFYLRHQRPEAAAALGAEFLPLMAYGTLPEPVREPLVSLIYALREGSASLETAQQSRSAFLSSAVAHAASSPHKQNFISNALSESSIKRLWTLRRVEFMEERSDLAQEAQPSD